LSFPVIYFISFFPLTFHGCLPCVPWCTDGASQHSNAAARGPRARATASAAHGQVLFLGTVRLLVASAGVGRRTVRAAAGVVLAAMVPFAEAPTHTHTRGKMQNNDREP